MHEPADDLDAIEADVLQVDPEVAQLHLEVLRIWRHQDQPALRLQGLHRHPHQPLHVLRPHVLDQVGGEYAVEFPHVGLEVGHGLGGDGV